MFITEAFQLLNQGAARHCAVPEELESLLIALDYDETYTIDPEFWDMVIAAANYRDHSVICATMRHEHVGADVKSALGKKVEAIIFTGRKAKYEYVQNAGYCPSVWVDDSPHWLFQDAL